jgi:putative ABC transport system permease protein
VQRVERLFTIVGVVERDPSPGQGIGVAGLMIPLEQAKAISDRMVTNAQSILRGPSTRPRTYPTITVRVTAAQHTQDVQEEIKAMGFTAFSLNDALEGAKRAFILLDILLGLVGSIALAVSSLGIVNTMVMSILERTREIGIMKAIGGSDRDVRGIFLVEATTIGALGGVLGIALGWVVGRVINFGANVYIESQGGTAGNLFALPWWLIAGALGFAILVSLAAGSYPARRAARLDPIQALRHE